MKAGNLTIKWRHGSEIGTIPTRNPLKRKIIVRHNRTFCELFDEKGNLIQSGYSLCATGDCFCKETGRKLSLARAMKNANIPKEERRVIWEIYRNTKLGGRW